MGGLELGLVCTGHSGAVKRKLEGLLGALASSFFG